MLCKHEAEDKVMQWALVVLQVVDHLRPPDSNKTADVLWLDLMHLGENRRTTKTHTQIILNIVPANLITTTRHVCCITSIHRAPSRPGFTCTTMASLMLEQRALDSPSSLSLSSLTWFPFLYSNCFGFGCGRPHAVQQRQQLSCKMDGGCLCCVDGQEGEVTACQSPALFRRFHVTVNVRAGRARPEADCWVLVTSCLHMLCIDS